MTATRPRPEAGMAAAIAYPAAYEDVVVEEVLEGGRLLVAGGMRFELNALTGHYVRAGEPYYGLRLVLRPG